MTPSFASRLGALWIEGRVAGNVLAGAALTAPAMAIFAPLGLAPLLAIVAVILIAGDWHRSVASLRPFAVAGALVFLLSLWAALSSTWSPVPGHSLSESARLLLISAGGFVVVEAATALGPAGTERLRRSTIIGAAIAAVLLQAELWDNQALAHILTGLPSDEPVLIPRYDRGVTLLLLVFWPAAIALMARSGRWAVIVAAVIVSVTLVEFKSQAAALAMLVGLAAALLAWQWPRLVAACLIGGLVTLAFVFPLVAPDGRNIEKIHEAVPSIKGSGIHRLAIWRFTAERISERPILGWGMDASRALPGGKAQVIAVMPEIKLNPYAQTLPLHPHDAALQWRVELGVPGALLCIALFGSVLWRIARDQRTTPSSRAFIFGYAAAAITVAMLSFGAWQAWWLSSLWLTAGFLAGIRESTDR